jgi:nitrate/nitrite transporter NarK
MDIKEFKLPYWILVLSSWLTLMTIFPYFSIAPAILQSKFGFNVADAGFYSSIPFIITAICLPISGVLIDIIGKRAHLITLASLIMIGCYTNSAVSPACFQCDSEVISLILCGIAYSIYHSAIWGSIPYVVDPGSIGTAFGIMQSCHNFGEFTSRTVVGFIQKATQDDESSCHPCTRCRRHCL